MSYKRLLFVLVWSSSCSN